MAKNQDSTILGDNLQKSYEESSVFKENNIDVERFRSWCGNLWCECYEKPLTVEELVDISKDDSKLFSLPYAITENAHIAASSISKKEKYTSEQYNSAINGLDLCPTCHKSFDRNGGNFSPDNEGKAFHSKMMERIIQSKISINDYAKIKKCL